MARQSVTRQHKARHTIARYGKDVTRHGKARRGKADTRHGEVTKGENSGHGTARQGDPIQHKKKQRRRHVQQNTTKNFTTIN